MYRYFKRVVGVGAGNYIYFWKSKGLSDENITSDYSLNPQLSYLGTKTRVKFDRSCFKQDKVTFNHKKVVNIYIVYETTNIADLNGNGNRPTIQKPLFGAISLTKMLISISTNTLDMELNLIKDQTFHFRFVDLVKM